MASDAKIEFKSNCLGVGSTELLIAGASYGDLVALMFNALTLEEI